MRQLRMQKSVRAFLENDVLKTEYPISIKIGLRDPRRQSVGANMLLLGMP